MKKMLFSAMAAALFLVACGPKAETSTVVAEQQPVAGSDLAYIQVEKVMVENDLYQQEGLPLEEKTRKAQESWAKKQQNLQWEANQLQEKYQKGLITSFDAQKQQESIQKRATNLESSMQKEGASLEEENMVMLNRNRDLLMRAVEQINADKKYKMIVNASALIDADTTLDITNIVLERVNELYAEEKKEK